MKLVRGQGGDDVLKGDVQWRHVIIVCHVEVATIPHQHFNASEGIRRARSHERGSTIVSGAEVDAVHPLRKKPGSLRVASCINTPKV